MGMTEQTGKRTRKRHSAEFKAQVVTAALREDQTLNQLSTRLGVHPVVVGDWKQQALLALPGLFGQQVQRDAEAVAAPSQRRPSAPAKASTPRGGSPRQAERSPACNRRLLRRGNTRWEAAGGEPPVGNNVTCLTGHTVNPIRPRRPASLRALCEARARTLVGSLPSAFARRQGPLAGGHEQRGSVNERQCRGWGGEGVRDGEVGRVDERSRETRRDPNGVHGR
jgi:transposase-like protein